MADYRRGADEHHKVGGRGDSEEVEPGPLPGPGHRRADARYSLPDVTGTRAATLPPPPHPMPLGCSAPLY